MGKGDKRTLRGKIYKGSYGNARPHKVRKAFSKPAPAKK
jgi:30S ribosomal protein S31